MIGPIVELDNLPDPNEDTILKRRIKAIEKNAEINRKHKNKSNQLLKKLLGLGRQSLIQISPAREDLKAELKLVLDETDAHLRDQGLQA